MRGELNILKMLFGKTDKREGNKPRSDFEEGIWNQIIDCGTNRSVMPVRSYAVSFTGATEFAFDVTAVRA